MLVLALMVIPSTGTPLMPSAIEPNEARGLLEIIALVLGVSKYAAAAVAVGAAGIAVGQHSSTTDEQPPSFWISVVVAGLAAGWFLAGLSV